MTHDLAHLDKAVFQTCYAAHKADHFSPKEREEFDRDMEEMRKASEIGERVENGY